MEPMDLPDPHNDPDPRDPLGEPDIPIARRVDDDYHPPEHDFLYLDPIGRALGELEAAIENTVLFPEVPGPPEAPEFDPAPASVVGGTVSREPAPLPEPGRVPWTELQPTLAATPFFTRDGLGAPVYRPRGGRGAGATGGSFQPIQRVCPETKGYVSEDQCNACDQFRDWSGDGSGPVCYYEWQEQIANDGENES